MKYSSCRGRGATALLMFLALQVLPFACHAVNLGKLFKRRPMSSRQLQKEANPDVEASADEARKYHSHCDQELAKSLIILGEQKEQSEAALDSCKLQRDKARDNAEYLTKKVEIVTESLDESDERCNTKIDKVKVDYIARVEELETQIENTNKEHVDEIERLAFMHQSERDGLITTHRDEMKTQHEANEAKLAEIYEDKERMAVEVTNEERASAKEKLDNTLESHKKTLSETESKWKSRLGEVDTALSECNSSLQETSVARDKLERSYERALQKIAVLENVTAYSLAVEEAKELADFTKQVIFSLLNPSYEQYLKEHVNSAATAFEEAKPMLEPVVQPITMEYKKVRESLRGRATDLLDEVSTHFENNVCPERRHLRVWEKQHNLDAVFSRAFDEACGNAHEFLALVGWTLAVFVAWVLRWYILRAIFFIMFSPIKLFFFPFRLVLGSRRKASKDVPLKGK